MQEYWGGLPFPSPGIFPAYGSNRCLLCLLQIHHHCVTWEVISELWFSSNICPVGLMDHKLALFVAYFSFEVERAPLYCFP